MKGNRVSFGQGVVVLWLYCLPAFIVLAGMLFSYHMRVTEVADHIDRQRLAVEQTYLHLAAAHPEGEAIPAEVLSAETLLEQMDLGKGTDDDEGLEEQPRSEVSLFFIKQYLKSDTDPDNPRVDRARIDEVIFGIWLSNSVFIAMMTLIPFFQLGGGLAFSTTLPLNFSQRQKAIPTGWWMRLIVAFIVAYGWTYILNPAGRGGSTITQFLIAADLSRSETLPLFLTHFDVSAVIAGFLGWYLYMLTYFFSKMTTDDVASSKAYGMLMQKFLFTWGLTIIFISGMEENASITAFLIGYFPMAAFSLIKDRGLDMMEGARRENGQLSELPGISRWQILRLEEEGINSLGALAYRKRRGIDVHLPGMAKVVDFWSDIAKLYTVVGHENYDKIRSHSQTASEFVIRAQEPEFVDALTQIGVHNTAEYARLLPETFPDLARYTNTGHSKAQQEGSGD